MATDTVSAPQHSIDMPAEDLRRFVGVAISSEGVKTAADLRVTQRAAGANMTVDVAAGTGYIMDDHTGGGGFYHASWSALENVTITAAHASLPRVDRVILRIRDQFMGDADNTIALVVLAGTPTSGATLANCTGAQTVTGSSLLLANVLVAALDTSITDAEIDTTGAQNNSPPVRPLASLAGGVVSPALIMTEQSSNSARTVGTANKAWLNLIWVPARVPITEVRFGVGVTGGNMDIGIYNTAFTRLWSRASFATPAAGSAAVLISAGTPTSLTLEAGNYWAAITADGTTATFNAMGGGANLPTGLLKSKTSSLPLPATIVTPADEIDTGTFAIGLAV